MLTPDGWVNFSEYLGLNREEGEAMARRLAERAGAQEEKLRTDAGLAGARAWERGWLGEEGGMPEQTSAALSSGLASYGDAVEAMQNAQSRQAALSRAYGGQASTLDTALAGAAGAGVFGEAKERRRALEGFLGRTRDETRGAYELAKKQRAQLEQEAASRRYGISEGERLRDLRELEEAWRGSSSSQRHGAKQALGFTGYGTEEGKALGLQSLQNAATRGGGGLDIFNKYNRYLSRWGNRGLAPYATRSPYAKE